MHVFRARFKLGDAVYYRPARNQCKALITAVTFDAGGGTRYCLSWGDTNESWHYEGELSETPDSIYTDEDNSERKGEDDE